MRAPVALLALGLLACGDKDDDSGAADSGAVTASESSFTAVVDGAAWQSAPASAGWTRSHGDALTLQGAPADSSSALIGTLSGYSGVGSYALTGGQTYLQLVGGATSSEPGAWVSTTGSVEITYDDGAVVQGTLSFEGTDADSGTTKVITDGEFTLLAL